MCSPFTFVLFICNILYAFVEAAPAAASSCTGTISSLSDVSSAVECSTVNINSFTVPAGETFALNLTEATTVNLNGNITFGNLSSSGPLFEISGHSIIFNGNGYSFDGGGPFYWDGQGTNGGVTKPHPMMKIKISGTWSNVHVVNSPAQVYSVSNPAALTMSNLVIDNSQGNFPNNQSDSLPAGHNTDGFDVSTNDLTIENSVIVNQDDCIAINKGTNIVFRGNTCEGGHGISIGSISSNITVSGVVISGNMVINEAQSFRIKTDASATNSTVTNITYSGNTASGIGSYGVIIDQSYPSTLGTPGNGVIVSDITFEDPQTTIAVNSSADQIAINCGSGSCQGTWNWSGLLVNGGNEGPVDGFAGITGYEQQ